MVINGSNGVREFGNLLMDATGWENHEDKLLSAVVASAWEMGRDMPWSLIETLT